MENTARGDVKLIHERSVGCSDGPQSSAFRRASIIGQGVNYALEASNRMLCNCLSFNVMLSTIYCQCNNAILALL